MSENGRAPRSVSAVWDSGGTLMCTVHGDSLMPMPQLHFTKVNAAPNALWPFALRGFQRSGASPETAAYCTECRAVLRIRAPQQVLRPAPPVRRTVLTSTGAPLTHVPVRGRELVPSGVALLVTEGVRCRRRSTRSNGNAPFNAERAGRRAGAGASAWVGRRPAGAKRSAGATDPGRAARGGARGPPVDAQACRLPWCPDLPTPASCSGLRGLS